MWHAPCHAEMEVTGLSGACRGINARLQIANTRMSVGPEEAMLV